MIIKTITCPNENTSDANGGKQANDVFHLAAHLNNKMYYRIVLCLHTTINYQTLQSAPNNTLPPIEPFYRQHTYVLPMLWSWSLDSAIGFVPRASKRVTQRVVTRCHVHQHQGLKKKRNLDQSERSIFNFKMKSLPITLAPGDR